MNLYYKDNNTNKKNIYLVNNNIYVYIIYKLW